MLVTDNDVMIYYYSLHRTPLSLFDTEGEEVTLWIAVGVMLLRGRPFNLTQVYL